MAAYELAIGDRTYSSWSLRGWLMFVKFDIPVTVRSAVMKTPAFTQLLADFGNARTVPAMRNGDVIVSDSLAMAETLAEQHPLMWPEDPVARGVARSLVAEMHAGFSALRAACPMNLRRCYDGFAISDAVRSDVARIDMMWQDARRRFGSRGPWLFGEYSLADVFFAPVAMRFATYQLPVSDVASDYISAHMHDRDFRQWRACGLAENHVRDYYDLDLPERAWPGPAALQAKAVRVGEAINANCPFSAQPVVSQGLADLNGTVIGFCNGFCRDKFVADPEAWPKAMAVLPTH